MVKRDAEKELTTLSKQFKAVALVGPRQSGKTTLTRSCFTGKEYVSLENPDQRAFAREDPRGFLSHYPNGAILDEAQHTPEIFSYLQQMMSPPGRANSFLRALTIFYYNKILCKALQAGLLICIFCLFQFLN